MPPGRKRGRHCEKYRPCFGAFCKKGDTVKSAALFFCPNFMKWEGVHANTAKVSKRSQNRCYGRADIPAPALPPHIPPEKRSKWRRQPHIFLKNLPSLTETFLGQISGDSAIRRIKIDGTSDLKNILYFELTTKDMDGNENVYQLELSLTEITKSDGDYSAYPAGAARYALAGKNFLSYTKTFFRYFQVGKSKIF